MFKKLAKKIFGSSNDRTIQKIRPIVDKINALEESIRILDPDSLKNKTHEFKARIQKGETLEDLLPEAYAVLREAAVRAFSQRAYDVQLIGGIVLNGRNIAEMRTGEGKTLTAAFPSYLNSLSGKGVHVITVNDYLAKRDSEKMQKLFSLLDVSVGCNISGMLKHEKDDAYNCDITYGTANEFGFDYLRDNMALSLSGRTQRELNFVIIDEADSVLIDEARTPLIISDANKESIEYYTLISQIPKLLEEGKEVKTLTESYEEGDYYIDYKNNSVTLTESGYEKAEKELIRLGLITDNSSLYDFNNNLLLSVLIATIKAHTLFHKDKQYLISDEGEIKIIDEHTGRVMDGRRWNDGIHQAVEAKEGVEIKAETDTLATITLQNYFRLYKKMSGMTGTADTEAFELNETYGLNTVVIPTNKPILRKDANDKLYRTFKEKVDAVIQEVKRVHHTGQPILLGTSSVENNEIFYQAIKDAGLKANILNAKNHLLEAEIISQAGKKGAITVATNMAGRGTDIILGGNIEGDIDAILNNEVLSNEIKAQKIELLEKNWEIDHAEILSLGGLHVIGTERHESRRIDNQLRGRAGRQGDPGSSIFFASFEDDLLRPYFDKMKNAFKFLNIQEGEAFENKLLTKQVASAQEKVEKMHYDMRKNLQDFDTTVSLQRKHIYEFRDEILKKNIDDPKEKEEFNQYTNEIIQQSIERKLEYYLPKNAILETWDIIGLIQDIEKNYDIALPITPPKQISFENDVETMIIQVDKTAQTEQPFDKIIYGDIFDPEQIHEKLSNFMKEILNIKLLSVDEEHLAYFKKTALLQIIDRVWREHLTELEHLKKGIHLRGYAQKDPKQEYKKEAFKLFQLIPDLIQDDYTQLLMTIKIETADNLNQRSQEFNKQLEDVASE